MDIMERDVIDRDVLVGVFHYLLRNRVLKVLVGVCAGNCRLTGDERHEP